VGISEEREEGSGKEEKGIIRDTLKIFRNLQGKGEKLKRASK